MEEKQLTEKESLEVITSMIARTKERYVGNGKILLMWGYLVVTVAILNWVLVVSTGNRAWHWLWFAIPLIGYPTTLIMSREQERERDVITYSDKMTSKLWTLVGISEFVAILLCFAIQFAFAKNCWFAMMVYSILILPIAVIIQGSIIKERSFVVGGSTGLTIGLFMLCCAIGRVAISGDLLILLLILAIISTMIIPGHTLNYKAIHQ